jgi:hypothetical protein
MDEYELSGLDGSRTRSHNSVLVANSAEFAVYLVGPDAVGTLHCNMPSQKIS